MDTVLFSETCIGQAVVDSLYRRDTFASSYSNLPATQGDKLAVILKQSSRLSITPCGTHSHGRADRLAQEALNKLGQKEGPHNGRNSTVVVSA